MADTPKRRLRRKNSDRYGSGSPDIALFEPRQSNDLSSFGNQKAVYAAGDGLWAKFFATVDRDRFAISVNNACIRLADEERFHEYATALQTGAPWPEDA